MKNLNIYAVALAFTLAACTNKEEIEIPQQDGSLNTVTADIVQLGLDSRVSVGTMDQDNKYPLTWIKGDMFAAYSTDGRKATYRYQGENGQKSGKFVIEEYYENNLNYYMKDISFAIGNIDADAIWKDPDDPNSNYIFDFNSGGTASSYSTDHAYFPMYGAWNNDKTKLKFYPVIGLLKVKVKVENGYTLVFACDNNHCIGDEAAYIEVGSTPESAKLVVSKWGVNEREIPFGRDEFLIPLPPQDYESFTMYVKKEMAVGNNIEEFRSKSITFKSKAVNGKMKIEKKIYDLGELDFGKIDGLTPLPGETIEWERVDDWNDVIITK